MATAKFIATCAADRIAAQWWIEIEGIRRRYGTCVPAWAPTSDTGTYRVIRPWMSRLPSMSGQVAEPLSGTTRAHSFDVEIADVNDELTTLFSVHDEDNTNVSFLAAAATSSDLSITVTDASVFSAPCDLFINRETVRATAIVGNVITITRAMYGSTAQAHPISDSQGNAITVEVRDRPGFMHTREVILCESRDSVHWSDDEMLEIDAIKYRGFLDSYAENLGVWSISVSGWLKKLNGKIGETLARGTLRNNLWGASADDLPGSGSNLPCTYWCIRVSHSDLFQSSGHVKIDDEIIKYVSVDSGTLEIYNFDTSVIGRESYYPLTQGRGVFSHSIWGNDGYVDAKANTWGKWDSYAIRIPVLMRPHSAGAQVSEVIHSSSFDATDPATVILTLLTSTGTGTNGTYDDLPAGWGLGIPAERLDTTGIESMCRNGYLKDTNITPFCIPDAVDCKKWLEENVLRPCHLFFVETEEGKISVRRLYDKNEAATLATSTTINHSVLLSPPTISYDTMPISKIVINCNYNPGTDKYLGKINVVLANSRDTYQSSARTYEFDMSTVYDYRIGEGSKTWSSADIGDMSIVARIFLPPIWDNYAIKPCPVVEFEVPYNYFYYVQVGQVIKLTSTSLPNSRLSARGMTNEYFQVVESTPQPERSSVRVAAWQIGIHQRNTRLLAPSAMVSGYSNPGPLGDPRITLYDSTFADGTYVTYDVDAFDVGDKIILVDQYYVPTGGAVEVQTIKTLHSGAAACWIDLTAVPTNPPSDGDYIDTAPYDSCVATQKATWAYEAGSDGLLGAAGDAGHRRSR